MVKECSVLSCHNNAINTQLFNIPKHPVRSHEWLYANPSGWKDVKNKYVCIKHFERDMLLTSKRTRVKPDGVPSIFSNEKVAAAVEDGAGRVKAGQDGSGPSRGLR